MKVAQRVRRVLVAATALVGLAAGVVVAAGAQAQDRRAELPGGMANHTVAVGRVDADSRQNWQRLGTYVFADDGTVSESHWHWTQRRREVRSYTGGLSVAGLRHPDRARVRLEGGAAGTVGDVRGDR